MTERPRSPRRAWSLLPVSWFVGTLSLLAPPLTRWIATPVAMLVPQTPVDHVNYLYARLWTLIQEARTIVPAGQSYTAIARDKEEEMLLLILSMGVLWDRVPMPSSYWKGPVAEGARARYILSYECFEPIGPVRLVRRSPVGCVWERADPAR